MTDGKAFVDTNILLRALSPQMNLHADAEALVQQMWQRDTELWISRQVIREYLVQITHPNTLSPPLTLPQVFAQLETIYALFHVADENQAVTEQLLHLLQVYPTRGKQIHDANIVATMLAYKIDTLLTINVADFRRFSERVRLVGIDETT